jgi:hypothetical protein
LKANIALGGKSSVDTYIINNKIAGSPNEGIFIIQGGQAFILRNKIIENNDGIVCAQAVPLI